MAASASRDMLQAWNARTGAALALEVGRATTLWQRLRGLLGRPPLRAGEGLLIEPCNGIHTAGMREAIDAVFLDRDGYVVRCVSYLAPYRMVPLVRGARCVLELPAGTLAGTGTVEGDTVRLAPADADVAAREEAP